MEDALLLAPPQPATPIMTATRAATFQWREIDDSEPAGCGKERN
jgi:hypothetical protein